MATLFGSSSAGDNDGNWWNTNNWFFDSFGGTPAGVIPQDNDDVFVDGSFSGAVDVPVSLNSLDNTTVVSADLLDYTNVTIKTSLNVFAVIWITDLPITANATFNHSCTNYGNVYGTISCSDYSNCNGIMESGSIGSFDSTGLFGAANNADLTFTNGSGLFGDATDCKIRMDSGSVTTGSLPGHTNVLSFDNGTTWFVGQSRLPAASSVTSPAVTFDSDGDSVVGTASSGGEGINGAEILQTV